MSASHHEDLGLVPSHVAVKLTLGQAFLIAPRISLVIVDTQMPHTHLHVHLALTRKTNVRSLGSFHTSALFQMSGSTGQRSNLFFFNF